jgi:hypothetical protein
MSTGKAMARAAVAALAAGVRGQFGKTPSETEIAVAPKTATRIPVVDGIDVVEVTPETDYKIQPKHNADFMCIDAHAFGVSDALEWTRKASGYARSQKRRPPLIALLADDDKLNQKDYRLATREFVRAGGFFYEYPDGCRDFIDALKAFAKGLARSYRAPILKKE